MNTSPFRADHPPLQKSKRSSSLVSWSFFATLEKLDTVGGHALVCLHGAERWRCGCDGSSGSSPSPAGQRHLCRTKSHQGRLALKSFVRLGLFSIDQPVLLLKERFCSLVRCYCVLPGMTLLQRNCTTGSHTLFMSKAFHAASGAICPNIFHHKLL